MDKLTEEVYQGNKLTKQQLVDKFKNLQLLAIDADGTLTDGKVSIYNDGMQSRHFYAHDGVGLAMVQAVGVKLVLLTSSNEQSVARRCDIMKCDHFIYGTLEKYKELKKLTDSLNIPMENVAHIGDDVNDVSALLRVGIPLTVSNAVKIAKDVSVYVTGKRSEEGAVREYCDLILYAKTGRCFGAPFVVGDDYTELENFYKKIQENTQR